MDKQKSESFKPIQHGQRRTESIKTRQHGQRKQYEVLLHLVLSICLFLNEMTLDTAFRWFNLYTRLREGVKQDITECNDYHWLLALAPW